MMSTLISSLMSLNNGKVGNPMPPEQPPVVGQGKRFAQVMAKAMVKTQANAAQTAPPVLAKPSAPANTAPSGASSETSRAEANAREAARTAARALATRALVRVPASEVNPQNEPRIEPHLLASDGAPTQANKPDDKPDTTGAVLSAEMAAWVAALNPAPVQPATTASAEAGGEIAVSESQLATQMAMQAAGQNAADKNTQVRRDEADVDRADHIQHGVTSQRAANDLRHARAGSDGAGQPGRDGQPADSRSAREALEARAAARTQTDVPTITAAANAVVMLSKEVASPAVTSAINTNDFSALMASSLSAPSGTTNTTDTLTLSLPTPVNAPEFREALSVQVSLLARDGVQTAELHLNPTDMGPVSIQIVMDGSQARVDFGADVAATRAAIEASMPELASALLDAGFTLTGGGVSQHAKGQGQGQSQSTDDHRQRPTRRNVVASTVAIPSTQALQRRVQLTPGGIDLFA